MDEHFIAIDARATPPLRERQQVSADPTAEIGRCLTSRESCRLVSSDHFVTRLYQCPRREEHLGRSSEFIAASTAQIHLLQHQVNLLGSERFA